MNLIGRSAVTGWVQVVLPGGNMGGSTRTTFFTTISLTRCR
ncbi:MAG: hypothetical protein M5U34_01675 [Chloroflexi bacterium]|nr:hypothetical protein [Chloroflexota bacterium]